MPIEGNDEVVEELASAIEKFAKHFNLSFREALYVIADEHVRWSELHEDEHKLSFMESANRMRGVGKLENPNEKE